MMALQRHFRLVWCALFLVLPENGQCFHGSLASKRMPFALPMTPKNIDRRRFFVDSLCWAAGVAALAPTETAQARGLVQFPCREGLGNTYHFMRAGESILESEDIWSTNPLFL